jgi:hypothetical protein
MIGSRSCSSAFAAMAVCPVGAAESDGVIHFAYVYDFSNIEAAGVTDLRAVQTIGAALEGSGKPFVGTSGTLPLAMLGRVGPEEDAGPAGVCRIDSENEVMSMAECGVRSSFVRLAPSVHGEGDKHGFVPSLISIARAKGVSAFVGDDQTAGLLCIGSMQRACSGWPSKQRRLAHDCTEPARRARARMAYPLPASDRRRSRCCPDAGVRWTPSSTSPQ